jgi:hypothetical protein
MCYYVHYTIQCLRVTLAYKILLPEDVATFSSKIMSAAARTQKQASSSGFRMRFRKCTRQIAHHEKTQFRDFCAGPGLQTSGIHDRSSLRGRQNSEILREKCGTPESTTEFVAAIFFENQREIALQEFVFHAASRGQKCQRIDRFRRYMLTCRNQFHRSSYRYKS